MGAPFVLTFEEGHGNRSMSSLSCAAHSRAERKKFTEGSKGASFARAFEKIMAKNAKVQAKTASKPEAAATAPPGTMPPPILSVSPCVSDGMLWLPRTLLGTFGVWVRDCVNVFHDNLCFIGCCLSAACPVAAVLLAQRER